MDRDRDRDDLSTLCARGVEEDARGGAPLTPPIVTSSTYGFGSQGEVDRWFDGAGGSDGEGAAAAERCGHLYTRYGNPTVEAAEGFLAALDGAEATALFGSGMAAIATVLLHHGKAGGRIAAQRGLYGGSVGLLEELESRHGVTVEWLDLDRLDRLRPEDLRGRALLWLESPMNPTLRLVDLERVAATAREAGVPTAVDTTFAPPTLQRPLALGIDLAVHSATKYLGGHSDLTGGAVSGRRDRIEPLRERRKLLGGILDPFSAFLLHRGMRTLAVRMERHCANARAVAEALAAEPAVLEVHYPGLDGSPDRALAARQMPGGAGGMVAFRVRGGAEAALRLHDRLKLFTRAGSLGGVESLVCLPCRMSHRGVDPAAREAVGVTEDLVRLSVGIEAADALVADLRAALR